MEILSNVALVWFIAGVVLLLLEFVIPGVFILFFGLGAWVTALCVYLFEPSLGIQFVIFSVTSIISLILLRKLILNRMTMKTVRGSDPDEEFIGYSAYCIAEIDEGLNGKVEFKGTSWSAASTANVKEGQKVTIKSKEGLQLNVEPE
ncbi:NfeD family protein [Carboxylicivirga sp. N1Y90]|uniref:NfeD family protein n=1 Tax=Carboxylicivirga fragile TaxID=3417571 RepID=UPI003D3388C2|nr:NfeD family protein [Marinilabiliaceae bacterium N1Y90]